MFHRHRLSVLQFALMKIYSLVGPTVADFFIENFDEIQDSF